MATPKQTVLTGEWSVVRSKCRMAWHCRHACPGSAASWTIAHVQCHLQSSHSCRWCCSGNNNRTPERLGKHLQVMKPNNMCCAASDWLACVQVTADDHCSQLLTLDAAARAVIQLHLRSCFCMRSCSCCCCRLSRFGCTAATVVLHGAADTWLVSHMSLQPHAAPCSCSCSCCCVSWHLL
jgi:hypothetical protein